MPEPAQFRQRKSIRLDVSVVLQKIRERPAEISTLNFDDSVAEVLRPPRKWRRKSGKEPLELVVQAKLQFPDDVGVADMAVPTLVDTGCQVLILAGFELSSTAVLQKAPQPIVLVHAGRSTITGGQMGVFVTVSILVITPDGIRIFKCINAFVHVADIGPRLIVGYPFLLQYGLAVVPGQLGLVQIPDRLIRRKPTRRYQHVYDVIGACSASMTASVSQESIPQARCQNIQAETPGIMFTPDQTSGTVSQQGNEEEQKVTRQRESRVHFSEVPIFHFISACLTPGCDKQGYTMHTTRHFRVRFRCPECDPVKHEKSYLENKAREMGQRVRRTDETCRKGVQQMSITVPPLSLESAERAGTTPDSPRMEPPLSPLAPRNPDTFESPQDCSSRIPQGQNFVNSAALPTLLSQYTSSVRLKIRRLTGRAVMPTGARP